uniref:Uncharacterized protein n=1 Tax=Osugoroshi virus TaxID=2202814 RepID=A0A7R7YC42_9VIRU|nr:hypothetical protein [Osugoroshi virus]
MSNRIGSGALRRRQDAHRVRVNNINSDRFDKIQAIVSETGEIDLIKTYTSLLTSKRFDEIDRIIASFHNGSFVITLDIDSNHSSDPQFISLKDEIDVFYKNEGDANFSEECSSIPSDSSANTTDAVADEAQDCTVDVADKIPDKRVDVPGIYVSERLPATHSPDGVVSEIKGKSKSESVTAQCKRVRSVGNSYDYPSSVIIYHEALEDLETVFFDSEICAAYNTTFVTNQHHEVMNGMVLTNNTAVFKASKSIKIAILGTHHVIPDLGSCFLLRSDKSLLDVFVLRVRQNPRRTKINWSTTVDLTHCVNWKTPSKRRKLSLPC